ncbi:helix-turn-helix domain-containing protein [Microbacterium xylanilyticum]
MSASIDFPRSSRGAQTYLPEAEDRGELRDFAEVLRELEASFEKDSASKAALVDPQGRARPIPEEIFRILDQVTNALAGGDGITVIPQDMMMTTQQAADFLGVSRPTLVRLLEEGEIPFDRPGRHRRVRLRDLVEYQETFRAERRAALRELQRADLDAKVRIGDPARVRRLDELDAE